MEYITWSNLFSAFLGVMVINSYRIIKATNKHKCKFSFKFWLTDRRNWATNIFNFFSVITLLHFGPEIKEVPPYIEMGKLSSFIAGLSGDIIMFTFIDYINNKIKKDGNENEGDHGVS